MFPSTYFGRPFFAESYFPMFDGLLVPPTVPGIEYTWGGDRMHYRYEGDHMHYTWGGDRLHYRLPEE